MSAICDLCGYPIEDGVSICPGCGSVVSGGQASYGDSFSSEDSVSDPIPVDPAPELPAEDDPIIDIPAEDEDDIFDDDDDDVYEDEFDDDDEDEPEPEPEPKPAPKPVEPPKPAAPTPPVQTTYTPPKKKRKKKGCCGCGCFLPLLLVLALLAFVVFPDIGGQLLAELDIPLDTLLSELPFELPEFLRMQGRFSKNDLPADAVEFDGHYYYVFTGEFDSYEDAAQFCQDQGGYLATVSSPEENQFLYDTFVRNGYSYVYLGGSDAAGENIWSWSNGEAFDYTNWLDGEPNNDVEGESTIAMFRVFERDSWTNLPFHVALPEPTEPVTAELSASSILMASKNYYVEWLADNDPQTAWNEGADGIVGESVTFQFDNPYWLTGFEIQAGFQSSEKTYYNNARPTLVELAFSDGTTQLYSLEDVMETQYITFPEPVFTQSVTMTILDAVPGEKYEDACITELRYTAQTAAVGFVCEWGTYLPEE